MMNESCGSLSEAVLERGKLCIHHENIVYVSHTIIHTKYLLRLEDIRPENSSFPGFSCHRKWRAHCASFELATNLISVLPSVAHRVAHHHRPCARTTCRLRHFDSCFVLSVEIVLPSVLFLHRLAVLSLRIEHCHSSKGQSGRPQNILTLLFCSRPRRLSGKNSDNPRKPVHWSSATIGMEPADTRSNPT